MNIKTEIKHFSELTLDEFHDLTALRIAVFVVEQSCPYQELDGKDKNAYHVLIKTGEKETASKIIATARILKAGIAYPEVAIGRVVTDDNFRHLKLGHTLMETSIEFVAQNMGNAPIRLSAQSHLTDFYHQHGFTQTGKKYLEDGIPHSEMLFKPSNTDNSSGD